MRIRLLFAGLSLVLAAVTVGSILFALPVSRMQAVPPHAHLVCNSRTPGGFLPCFPRSGRGESLQAFGFPDLGSRGPQQAQGFPDLGIPAGDFSRPWKKSFQALEHRPLTVATVPFGGLERRDTWVAVSELGGPTALALRWRLMLFSPPEMFSARPYAAWPVWRVEHPALPPWAQVRFSVTESLLICSVSTDSRDIYRLLDAVDGRALSRADLTVK